MAYPPLWGYLVWSLLHSSGKAYAKFFKDKRIPDDISEQILTFMVRLCKYLPCPGCRLHCNNHTQNVIPRFFRGEDFWTYTVDFHNAVNTRTHKLTVSYADAEVYLNEKLQTFGNSIDHIEDSFLQDWWTAIILTTFSYSYMPDKPTEEEKTEYKNFLKSLCYVLPFSHKILTNGRLCRDVMLDFCDSPNMNVENRDNAFESITNLHNSVCDEFGIIPKTVKDMKEEFGKKFDMKASTDVTRATQIREEDHKKMSALQQELNDLRLGKNTKTNDSSETNSELEAYRTATIALGCILGVVLFVLLVLFIMYRFHIGGNWKIIRFRSGTSDDIKKKKYKAYEM
jgi:hypothetical protein